MTHAVIYDGDCAVCRRFVARLREWDSDGALEFLPSSDESVSIRFGWIPARAFGESVQLVRLSDGITWQGAAALEQLLRLLPRSPRAGWLFNLPFARPVAEAAYRAFAKNRRRMGCDTHCRTS